MNKSYIYRHIRLDTNEVFYVGVGTGRNYERANQKIKRNTHWHGVVAKCDYRVDIVMDGLSWDEAAKKEVEFIELYGRRDLKTGTLVNLCDGGYGGSIGRIVSKETREKISKANIGKNHTGVIPNKETRLKMSIAGKNRKMSENAKEALRIHNTGKKLSAEHIEKIRANTTRQLIEKGHPMQGRNHSIDAKIKIGIAQKGKIETIETRNKKALSHTGNKHSLETLAKMSEARKLYYENKRKMA